MDDVSNKATIRRFHAATNSGDIQRVYDTIDDFVAPDALIHTPLPLDKSGAALLKEVFTRLHRAFPDLHIDIQDQIEEGDKVVTRQTVTGTHHGEYMGLPPTGKRIAYNEVFIMRFADGRLAESWGVVDMLSLMRQLGALPA